MANTTDDKALFLLLGEMKGDLKAIIGSLGIMRNDHQELKAEVEKIEIEHNKRITQLEKIRWKLAGIALLVPILVASAGLFFGG